MRSFCGGVHGLALRVTGIVGDELSESSWYTILYSDTHSSKYLQIYMGVCVLSASTPKSQGESEDSICKDIKYIQYPKCARLSEGGMTRNLHYFDFYPYIIICHDMYIALHLKIAESTTVTCGYFWGWLTPPKHLSPSVAPNPINIPSPNLP